MGVDPRVDLAPTGDPGRQAGSAQGGQARDVAKQELNLPIMLLLNLRITSTGIKVWGT